jgi:hypothetical protein
MKSLLPWFVKKKLELSGVQFFNKLISVLILKIRPGFDLVLTKGN